MKKLLGIVVLGLLLSGNAYAKTFKIGLTFEEYYKSCKKYQRFNLINKKNLPSLVGQQGDFKVYNCITPDSVKYGSQVQVFENNILIRNERSEELSNRGSSFDINTFLIGLSLLMGETPSVSLDTNNSNSNTNNNGVNLTGGTFVRDMISGNNRICFYKTITGDVAITIKASMQCKPSLNMQ